MKNRYSKGAHVSEARFLEVIRFFAADLPALTATELSGLNYRTVHRIYSLMRERLVELTLEEMYQARIDTDPQGILSLKQRYLY